MVSGLKEKVRRLLEKVDAFAALSDDAQGIRKSELMREVRAEALDLYAEILELPDEDDRSCLFDDIIRGFKDAGIVSSTIKVLVDIFG